MASCSIPQLSNINKFDKALWREVIISHLKKMNYIVENKYVFPEILYAQIDIFNNQLQKYILRECPQIAVLSAFPMFMIDYAGCKDLRVILNL